MWMMTYHHQIMHCVHVPNNKGLSNTINFKNIKQVAVFLPSLTLYSLAPILMDFAGLEFDSRLNITEVEEGLLISGEEWDKFNTSTDLSLVGKILGHKNYHVDTVRNILAKAWSPGKGIDVKQINNGRLIFTFQHKLDWKRAFEGGPWSFDKRLVVLNCIKPDEDANSVELKWCDFHVHIKGLPLNKSIKGMVELICKRLGKFKGFPADSKLDYVGGSIRVRVGINITEPLPRFMNIRSDRGDIIVVNFCYEKLPNFCYYCVLFDHMSLSCNKRYDDY
ncbi:hypothetical protein ACJIZ3_011081 [Penstemon smallii]|uniref:DUF4283 domain-containing protein n=1 Tax=Penstemon smallii TaxID=265156 RepID=A0ABD3UI44_9LAMI